MQGAGVPHRVVVTGMGAVTPIGTTVEDFWAGCKRSQLGISPLDGFDDFWTAVARADDPAGAGRTSSPGPVVEARIVGGRG